MKFQQSDTLKKTVFCLFLLFLGLMSASITHAETYTFVKYIGDQQSAASCSIGSGDGQFNRPQGVSVDSSGDVYVADALNYRVQKFDSNGNYLTQWGSYGSGNGQFYDPVQVAVDSSGNVYVSDYYGHRIQKFDSNGRYLTQWGSSGSGDGQFNYLWGIAIDSSDNVYVVDNGNNRIQKFDSTGQFITKWGSLGTGDGQFIWPCHIAVDSSGNVYVDDQYNHRIQKFDSTGKYLTQWGSYGSGDGQFKYPYGVAVDSSGNVYVADNQNNRIQKFDSNGAFITRWGSSGSEDGQFYHPIGVAVDSSGNVYVADIDNHRIQKFAPNNLPVATPVITWNNPADITFGTALSTTQLNAVAIDPDTGAVVEGAYNYNPAAGTVLGAGMGQILHVNFKPMDTAKYNDASKDVTINVLAPAPPVINSITAPLNPVPVGTSITASADVTYLGDLSTLTAEWSWGDGSTSKPQDSSSNFATSHVYNSPGIYTVNLKVTDADGKSETKEASNYIVVYDPQGGFVTGGGWINSPEGAYVADKTLAGKATFGFVSKYQKGATVPTGKTEFQFNAGDLNFHSENYDWLVIAGSQAKYKGTGTINGQGNYGFMLSAFDGTPDKFRIKIWDKESNAVIYDNQIGAAEDSEPTTAIGGGSIIIHNEK